MTNPNIRIKRSAVPGKRPSNSQIELGELALNTNDGRLFTKKENVGIGTTVTLLNVWTENVGGGAYYNDGSVGIGTTAPRDQGTLEVVSTVPGGGIRVSSFGNNSPGFRLVDNETGAFAQNLLSLRFGNGLVGSVPGDYCIRNSAGGGILLGVSTSLGITNPNEANGYVRLTPSGEFLIGTSSTITTGTPGQNLQVIGGAYVSGNIGVGTTNPTSRLHVSGDALVTGVVTATTFVGALSGTATSTVNIPNLTGDVTSNNTVTTLATVNSNVGTFGGTGAIPVVTVNGKGLVTGVTTVAPNNGTLTLAVSGTGLSGSASFTANQAGNSTFTVTSNATSNNTNSTIVARNGSGGFSAGIVTATQFSTGSGNVAIGTNIITGPAEITIDPAAVGDNTGAVRIKGDLYVDGTQTIINSSTIELADFNVGIATTVGTNLLLDGAGIGIGASAIRKTITWNNSASALTSSEDWNLVSGKQYEINGTSVLSSTTLGSGVVNSSLTSVGTLNNLNVSGISTSLGGFIGNLTGNLNSSGVNTATTISGTTITYTNGSITNISGTNLNYTGISTITNVRSTTLNNTGVGTITTLNSTTGIITDLNLTNLNVSGITTTSILNVGVGGTVITTTSNGLVGIGTTNPINNLQVFGGITAGNATSSTLQSGYSILRPNDSTPRTFAIVEDDTNLRIGGGAWNSVNIRTAPFNEVRVAITSSGNIGIGITNPTSRLHVVGDTLVTGVVTATAFNGNINSGIGTITNLSGTNVSYSGIGTVGSLNIGSTQVISSGRQLQNIASLDATTTATIETAIANAPNTFTDLQVTGLSTFTNGPVLIGSGTSTGTANQRLQVTGGAYISSNIGIGTTNPQSLLELYSNNDPGIIVRNSGTGVTGYILSENNVFSIFTQSGSNKDVLLQTNGGLPLILRRDGTVSVGQSIGVTNVSSQLFQVGTASSVQGAYISGSVGIGTTNPSARLTVQGDVSIASTVSIGSSIDIIPYDNLGTLSFEGSAGQLFSITNNLTSGSIFSVNDVSGIPSIDVDANGTVQIAAYGGNLGVGTTNPTSKLHVVGDVLVSGAITSTDYNSASDINLKENIKPISDPIDKVMNITGVSFNWKAGGKSSMGVIAQEIEKVMPEIVSGGDSKTVNYNGLIGLLIEVVKEQQKEINMLKENMKRL